LSTIQEIEAAVQSHKLIPPTDPVYARMKVPFERRFYPLGFPVDISTNSREVLEIAAEIWGGLAGLFQTAPIKLQIGVLDGNSAECPPAPSCRVQEHLFSFVADQENFGLCDLNQGFSSIWATQAAVKSKSYFRYFFLDCAIFIQLSVRCATGIHSGCVSKNGAGVLLCGDSGTGKSTLSYACAKAGWTYVTDDGAFLVHGSNDLLVVGNHKQVRFRPSAGEFFPEIQGRAIIQRAQFGKPSIEVSTDTLPDIRHSPTANVDCLVFLNRRDGIEAPPRAYSKKAARDYLMQGRFGPPEFMLRHHEAIERLLAADVLELRYRSLDFAIEQLNLLAESRRK
jgi:hypothetical protein